MDKLRPPYFHPATQEEIKLFYYENLNNPEIYPYFSISQYIPIPKVTEDDWSGSIFITQNRNCLLHITISRAQLNNLSFSMYSTNAFAAGRGMQIIAEFAKRYDSMAIESVVHATNFRSLKITEKMLGKPWGIEPNGAWNSKSGEWESLIHFKKIIKWPSRY